MAIFRNKLFVIGAWLAAMLAFYLFFRRPPASLEAHANPRSAPMQAAPRPLTADPTTPSAPGEAPAAVEQGPPIEGTITVAPELAGKASAGDTLFIIARKGTSGPPLAAKKLAVSHFPLKYTLGADNVMMQGMPWAGELQIIVRVDKDGNATTKSPGDIMGVSKQLVKVGAKDADIVLDQAL
jgi:cytochrome c-type biogenesis protein CcmH